MDTKLNLDNYKKLITTSFWRRFKAIQNLDDFKAGNWINKASLLNEISAQNNVAIFLYNTYSQQFIFMSDQMKILSGHEPALYTAENGIAFTFSNFNPKQVNMAIKSQDISLSYFLKNSVSVEDKVLINCDYLYRHSNGSYFQFLQQMLVVETDTYGSPLLVLSFGHNISHIKKEGSMSIIITAPWGNEFYSYNTDQNDYESVKPFSEQEIKVLLLLGQGFDSRKIADKLFISPHTVDTHRRSLIKKTNCIDTTSVVTYARMINLI